MNKNFWLTTIALNILLAGNYNSAFAYRAPCPLGKVEVEVAQGSCWCDDDPLKRKANCIPKAGNILCASLGGTCTLHRTHETEHKACAWEDADSPGSWIRDDNKCVCCKPIQETDSDENNH